MSINNDGRSSIMAVSRTSYLTSGTVYKRSVSGVEEKQHAERNVKSGIGELSPDRRKSTGNFFINNSAQEIHQTISDGFQELSFLSQSVLILLLTLIPRVTPSLITINEI